MSNTRQTKPQGNGFTVNRELWADKNIYFGADVYVSKIHDKDKTKGRIIGISEYNYLIMEMPMIIGMRSKFPVGSTVVTKFVRDGTVYGFYAEVLQTYFEPSSLMFLKYPREIESFEFRGSRRFVCNIPAHMTNETQHNYCIIKDISSSGCQLIVKSCNLTDHRCIEPDTRVTLSFNMCGFGEIELDCHIRNGKLDGPGQCYGLEFQNSGVAYDKIKKYFEMLCE